MGNVRGETLVIDGEKLMLKFRESKLGLGELAKRMGTTTSSVNTYFYDARTISKRMATMFARSMNCNVEDFTRKMNPADTAYMKMLNDETLEESYRLVINGIKRNIAQRLLVTHSKSYVDEILELMNDMTIESEYYGVEKKRLNEEQGILIKIKEKRKVR